MVHSLSAARLLQRPGQLLYADRRGDGRAKWITSARQASHAPSRSRELALGNSGRHCLRMNIDENGDGRSPTETAIRADESSSLRGARAPPRRRPPFAFVPLSSRFRPRFSSRRASCASLRGRRHCIDADSACNIKFNKALDFVGFCDLSRASPTPFASQTSLTGFGLTCHAPGGRALWRESLASVRFV